MSSNIMIVNDELEGVWKEVVRAFIKILFQNLHGGCVKNHKISVSQSSLLPNLILGPPKCRMEVLSIVL